MALFYYQTINAKGKKQQLVIEASSADHAKQLLRQQRVVVIYFSSSKKKSVRDFWTKELSEKQLYLFTTQLTELTKARLPLVQSLTALTEQAQGQKSQSILQTLIDRLKEGLSLSEAMALFPHIFPPLYRALIKAGERVGALDKSLSTLSLFLGKTIKLKKKITTALLYPIMLASFSCIVILVMLVFVIPSLESLFDQENVNRFTAIVMGISHFFTQRWPFLLGFIGAGVGYLYYLRKQPTWRELKDRFLLRLPLFRSLSIKIAVARFMRTLASLLSEGVPMIEALRIAKSVIDMPILEQEIAAAEKKIIEGSLLSAELQKISWMPKLAGQMVAIGEESGTLTSMLDSVAQMYEEEIEKHLTRIAELAQPLILLVMGAIVGLIMLAILLPITDTSHLL